MGIINIMGMDFEVGTQPDFGSIRMTSHRRSGKSKNEYLLKSADVSKLDLITNATDGSTAYCTDTGDLYLLHLGEWSKVGDDSE